jgi:hypothetical protein
MFRTPAIFELQANMIARDHDNCDHIVRADHEPKRAANLAEVKNGMERRRKTASENRLTPQNCEDLERIVVRLLEVAGRCGDPAIQHDLMKLADELVTFLEA